MLDDIFSDIDLSLFACHISNEPSNDDFQLFGRHVFFDYMSKKQQAWLGTQFDRLPERFYLNFWSTKDDRHLETKKAYQKFLKDGGLYDATNYSFIANKNDLRRIYGLM